MVRICITRDGTSNYRYTEKVPYFVAHTKAKPMPLDRLVVAMKLQDKPICLSQFHRPNPHGVISSITSAARLDALPSWRTGSRTPMAPLRAQPASQSQPVRV